MATPPLHERTSPTENCSIRDSASPGPFVLVGHSAGAAAACFIARLLAEGESTSLNGLVLIDGVSSPNHLIRRSLPFLASTPVAAVLAPPSLQPQRAIAADAHFHAMDLG